MRALTLWGRIREVIQMCNGIVDGISYNIIHYYTITPPTTAAPQNYAKSIYIIIISNQ
jgi:hypothetical protein